ncbi:MAG TPA: T9SS type B sorting domain-containing protein [Crocinitomix sp.]|nr:T9SS type B sorting domain-containing protein [Crocinitomix sp.]
MKNWVFILISFALLLNLSFAQDIEAHQGVYKFIPNGGQWPVNVLYRAEVGNSNIWLEKNGILYQFRDFSEIHHAEIPKQPSAEPKVKESLIYAQFVGANSDFETKSTQPTQEYYNFFLGDDPKKWATKLYGYHKVEYEELYHHINLVFFEKNQELKYEYHVKPSGNYKDIKLQYKGLEKIKIQKNGNVIIYSPLGQIIEQKPYVYQIKNGKIIEISSKFVLTDRNILSFEIGEYDKSLTLIIDPVLVFATYNGANSDNFGMTATYAYDGKAYTAGTLYGNQYPAPDPNVWNATPNLTVFSTNVQTTDVFLSKYSADGTQMIWTNFIGGGDNTQGTETVHSLICDTSNNLYMYGVTSSIDFPIVNGFQTTHNGGTALSINFNGCNFGTQGTDIFVAKFSEDGSQLFGSTYIGGSLNDGVNYKVTSGNYGSVAAYDSLTTNYGDQFRGEIMIDSLNNIIVCSSSRSTDFPTVNALQPNNAGQQDAVLFKISNDFSTLLWSTYYGGSENDAGYSVKIDSSYNVIFAGGTSSSDLPGTIGGLTPTYQGGKTDGYVVKLTPGASAITQATYIGTPTYDQTIFVEIDRWDNIYIVGQTDGSMPVINASYSNPNSGQFIMKLSPDLTNIIYSTIFGNGNGSPNISPAAFLVDVCGNVYVSGWGANILQGVGLTGMPTTTNAFQTSSGDGYNFYLFVLERDAQSLLYASYIGDLNAQEHVDGGTSRFDKFGVVYQSVCGGCGGSSSFPTTPNAWSSVNNSSNCNNLVFKFDFEIVPDADFLVDQLDGCSPLTITFDNESNDTINSVWSFPAGATIISGGANPVVEFTNPGTYEVFLSITDTICNLQDTAKKVITVYPALQLNLVNNDTVLCNNANTPFNLIADSYGTATLFEWSTDINFTTLLNSGAMDSVITVNPSSATTYYIHASNGWASCDIIDSVVVEFLDDAINLMPDTLICKGDTVNLYANYTSGGITNFDWSPNSSIIYENQNVALATPTQSQYYYLNATINGCVYFDSAWVQVDELDPNLVYATASPSEVPEGGTTTLQAFPDSSIYQYSWLPPNLVNNPSVQTTTATINQDQSFIVIVTKGACSVPTTVSVTSLEFICGDVYIYVPNAFTPNQDNNNDVVYVRGENIEIMQFMIFDRWGELVFESNDQNIGWDGTFKGEPLDPDVYVYHLKVTCVGGLENLIKGNITLLK